MQVLPYGLYCKRVKSKQTNKTEQNKQTTSNNYESELGTPILRRSILIID